MRLPRAFWRLTQLGPRFAYAAGLGRLVGRFVLLLTTRGRKTGQPRVTPLVFEETGDTILVGSARGPEADWLRNIRANPSVRVRVGRRDFDGLAEVVMDPERIADYLGRQFNRNPKAFGAILRAEGLPFPPSRADLVQLAPRRPMVAIRRVKDGT
jgi:deazaflavin-dependent oxidoreductase (nitroreductase family)